MQEIDSRSCCSLPRMMRLSCAIVGPISSTGSACVMRVGMAASMELRPALRDQCAHRLLLLLNLGHLAPQDRDARMHFSDSFGRGLADELGVAQLAFLFAEVLLCFRLALLQTR